MLPPDIFVAQADITQLAADVLIMSTSRRWEGGGILYDHFCREFQNLEGLEAGSPGPSPRSFQSEYARLAAETASTPKQIGDTRTIPVRGHGSVKAIVLTVAAGRTEMDHRDRNRLVVQNALKCALDVWPEGQQRLVVTFPAIGFGAGRFTHLVETARWQVEAAAEFARKHWHEQGGRRALDVVFCTFHNRDYQIFIRARREAEPGDLEPACPLLDNPHLPNLRRAVLDRRCVPFIGAGLSKPSGLPDWEGLQRELAHEIGLDPAHLPTGQYGPDLALDLAQWYVDHESGGRANLGKHIQNRYGNTDGGGRREVKPALAHYFLLSLPVRAVLTTNFDGLLERTLRALRRDPEVVVEAQQIALTGQDHRPCVVKLHGDAARPESIVLTRDDFDGFFRNRPAMAAFMQGLLLNQTFLFCGYGMRDPNTRQIFSTVAHWLQGAQRHAFALSVGERTPLDDLYVQQWGRQGLHWLQMEGENLAERIQRSLHFFDWLARETSDPAEVFLADNVTPAELPDLGPLHALGEQLRDVIPTLLESFQDLNPTRARLLARVLELFVGLGALVTEADLWERLADHALDDPEEQLRRLRLCLRSAGTVENADRIRARIEHLQAGHSPALE